MTGASFCRVSLLKLASCFVILCGYAVAQDRVQISVQTSRTRQAFEGVGAGAIFYEGHITSLAARNKHEEQEKLYDDMFTRVPQRYLQLMIREVHEPQNDNNDPYTPEFDDKNFEYCQHTLQIAKAALKRQPDMQFCATLYTPPPWMKTNNDVSAGGEARATIKNGLELEVAEYAWAFLAHMQKHGVTVQYLCIANEPDWPHTQPGYCLTAEKNALLFKTVGDYLDKMVKKYPDVPRPKMIGPNTLSAPGAAKDYVPQLQKRAAKYLEIIGAHDYDPRGDRWGALRKLAGSKPVWVTEWCARSKDSSPGMINSATEYGVAMHDAFQGGANVFLAYDWVYPPRDSGEALIHVDWGNSYTLTKPYHLFRQWAEPLKPGMKVLETGSTGRSASQIKPTAFLDADNRTLVVHVVNSGDKETQFGLKLNGKFLTATRSERIRTSATEDAQALTGIEGSAGTFSDSLPARTMTTYLVEAPAK